jgi:DNA-binding NarL/FixJ family response regulator
MMRQSNSLFLVEDHPVMRDALAFLIDAQPDLTLCGAAASAEEALERLPGGADLVLVDVSLPGMNGLEFVRRVSEQWPGLPCVVLSGHAAERYAEPAHAAGAAAYVMKDNADAVVSTIHAVLAIGGGDGRGSNGEVALQAPEPPL